MRLRLLLSLMPVVLTSVVVAACSDDATGSVLGGDSDAGDREVSDNDNDAGKATTVPRDSGAEDASSVDASSVDAADAGDAGTDTTPLACPPDKLPTTACANGLATTYVAATLPPQQFAGSVELDIDEGGFFHAAWAEQSVTPGVRYLSNTSGAFKVESLAGPTGLPSEALRFARLAIDDCGRPTVLYVRRQAPPSGVGAYISRIYVATRTKGGWAAEEVVVPKSAADATPGTDFDAVDLTTDGQHRPIVVTHRASSYNPVVSTKGAGGWTHEHLPVSTSGINLPRAAWSSTLGLVLAYAKGSTWKPAIAAKSGGTWTELEVPGSIAIDSFASNDDAVMAVSAAPDGTVHLTYVNYVGSRRAMRYSTVSSVAGGLSAPIAVPIPHAGLPIPMRVLARPGLEPRIVFEQFNGAQLHTYVSTMTAGAFGVAQDLGAYSGAGGAIDGNGRLHVLGSRYGAGSAKTTSLLTQACAP